jgi:hypothetical protein
MILWGMMVTSDLKKLLEAIVIIARRREVC